MGSAVKAIKICLTVLLVLFVAFIALGFFVSNDEKPKVAAKEEPKKEDVKKDAAPEKLDLSKPTFTQDYAAICPFGLIFDNRADHSPSAILDAIDSIWNRSSKLKDLGCEEWRGGIRVFASPMQDGDDSGVLLVKRIPDGDSNMFTLRSQLTNHDPDPSPIAERTPAAAPLSGSSVEIVAPDKAVPATSPATPAPPVNPPSTSDQPNPAKDQSSSTP
jgi:hypothetical protein